MPNPAILYTSADGGVVSLVSAAETVVATVNNVSTRFSGQNIVLVGTCLLTSPASTTAVKVRVRRGTLTGTVVGDATGQNIVAAAGSSNVYGIMAIDGPGDIANAVYVLTVECTAGNSTTATVYGFLQAQVS